MKYFRLLLTTSLALLITGFACQAMAADQIHFTLISPTAVTFDWSGSGAHTIYYGTTSGSYTGYVTASAASPTPWSDSGPYYEAKLTGLTADTLYYYVIDSGTEHTFKTMPNPGTAKTFRAVVQSDGGDHLHYSTFVPSENLVAQKDPDLVLYVGDTSHNNRDSSSYLGRIAHFQDVMAWSQDAPYMMTYGNHEWDKSSYDDLRNYKGRFDFPNPQTSPGSPTAGGEDWYWFDYGRVRFIAYPEPWTSSTWTDWQTKATTLMDQAQANSNIDFIVTYGHRPAYSSGHHPGNSTLKGILDTLGKNHSKYVLNLNGHSHVYERSYPQSGVVHVTDSSPAVLEAESGSCKYAGGCPPPSWSEYRHYHLGFVQLDFSPEGIQGSFICGPSTSSDDVTCAAGSVLDTWKIANPNHSTSTDTTAPTVSISSPAAGSTVSGTATLSATATDNVGVTKVEFYSGSSLIGAGANSSGSTWQAGWNTAGLTNGSYSLTAKAYDAAGNSKTSSAVTVTVSNAASTDKTPPTVSITSPAAGSTVSGTVSLSATASDNVKVAKVDFYSGTTLLGTGTNSTGSTWQFSWNTSTVSNASYSLAAKAYDAAGNAGASTAVTVSVSNSSTTTTKTLTFKPVADSYTRSASTSSNYGTKTMLYVVNESGVLYKTYLKFSPTGITGTVKSAKLRLYASNGTNNGPALYSTGSSWSETGITAGNAPAASGSALGDTGSIGSGAWVEYDVTAVVKGNGTYGFVLPPSSSDCLTLSSREGSNPPQLAVTFAQ